MSKWEKFEAQAYKNITNFSNIRLEAIRAKRDNSYSLTILEIGNELLEFYASLYNASEISLRSSNIMKYRKGWLLRADFEKRNNME